MHVTLLSRSNQIKKKIIFATCLWADILATLFMAKVYLKWTKSRYLHKKKKKSTTPCVMSSLVVYIVGLLVALL